MISDSSVKDIGFGCFRLSLAGERPREEDFGPTCERSIDDLEVELDALAASGHPESEALQRQLFVCKAKREKMFRIKLGRRQEEAIRDLADELDYVDHSNFHDAPWGSKVLIDSSVTGWAVVYCQWTGLVGYADDLRALCETLVGVGRKFERELAGKIRVRAAMQGAPSWDWPGDPPSRKRSEPRSIKAIAKAWSEGRALASGNVRTDGMNLYSWGLRIGRTHDDDKIAIDYRGCVSSSTSMHVGVAIKVATKVEEPP